MKRREPAWKPVEYETADVMALQALAQGVATPDQQARVLRWIVYGAAGLNEIVYFSDADGGDRETAFMAGRQFVGMQVHKLAAMPPRFIALMREKDANG